MKTVKFLAFFFIAGLSLTSCSDDDDNSPEVVNEEEVISDVSITFTDEGGASTTYTYTDPLYREDSYVDPEIHLISGETYTVKMNFYNNSDPEDPEVVTDEIREEKDDHFLEFAFQGANVTVSRVDEDTIDSNDVKIGLTTRWTAGDASQGSTTVTLIHQPETKDTSNPNGSHTGGETDAQVTYALVID